MYIYIYIYIYLYTCTHTHTLGLAGVQELLQAAAPRRRGAVRQGRPPQELLQLLGRVQVLAKLCNYLLTLGK